MCRPAGPSSSVSPSLGSGSNLRRAAVARGRGWLEALRRGVYGLAWRAVVAAAWVLLVLFIVAGGLVDAVLDTVLGPRRTVA